MYNKGQRGRGKKYGEDKEAAGPSSLSVVMEKLEDLKVEAEEEVEKKEQSGNVDPAQENLFRIQPEPEEDFYEDWQPLEEHYYSRDNLASSHKDQVGTEILGNAAPDSEIPLEEIPCRHSKGDGSKCFKAWCPYNHDWLDPKQFDQTTKLKIKKQEIAHQLNMPAKNHVGQATVANVRVQHVVDPWDFYVTPVSGNFYCACNSEDKLDDNEKSEYISEYDLRMKLTIYMTRGYRFTSLRHAVYSPHQVVAVRMKNPLDSSDKKSYFYRGIIEDFIEVLPNECTLDVKGKVYLCDIGLDTEVNILDIYFLEDPSWASKWAPLAVHCSLARISPPLCHWKKKHTEYFKTLVQNCVLEMTVVRTLCEKPNFREFKPYDVDLKYLDEVKDRYISVADLMADNGHGRRWALCPQDPNLVKRLNRNPSLGKFYSREMLSLFLQPVGAIYDQQGESFKKK